MMHNLLFFYALKFETYSQLPVLYYCLERRQLGKVYRPHLNGFGYPRQPSLRATLCEVIFLCVVPKFNQMFRVDELFHLGR